MHHAIQDSDELSDAEAGSTPESLRPTGLQQGECSSQQLRRDSVCSKWCPVEQCRAAGLRVEAGAACGLSEHGEVEVGACC